MPCSLSSLPQNGCAHLVASLHVHAPARITYVQVGKGGRQGRYRRHLGLGSMREFVLDSNDLGSQDELLQVAQLHPSGQAAAVREHGWSRVPQRGGMALAGRGGLHLACGSGRPVRNLAQQSTTSQLRRT